MVCVSFMTIAKRIRVVPDPRLLLKINRNIPKKFSRFREVASIDDFLNSIDSNLWVPFISPRLRVQSKD